jgi:hypothetical protein
MFTLRKEQFEIMDMAVVGQFEEEMLAHLSELNPKHSAHLGTPGLLQVIRLALQQSKTYGFTNRGPIRLYLDCMFFFGSYFDCDPQLPWANDILIDCQYTDQMLRAQDLWRKTTTYIDKVFGPERQHYLEAVGRMAVISAAAPLQAANRENALFELLNEVFPQKCEYLRESAIRKICQCGMQTARALTLYTDKSCALFTVLAFMLGHNFAADPQFPWAAAILNDPAAGTSDARIEKLYQQAQDYLQQTMS